MSLVFWYVFHFSVYLPYKQEVAKCKKTLSNRWSNPCPNSISFYEPLWPILGKFVQKLQRWIFYIDLTFLHTTGLIKHQESHKNKKRPTKVVKVNLKATWSKIWKGYDFFMWLGPFGVEKSGNTVFWSFKAIKAKKAAIVARNSNSHIWMSNDPKLVF